MSAQKPTRPMLMLTNYADLQRTKDGQLVKQHHWVKSWVKDLQNIDYRGLSLSDRGFLADFSRLAGFMENRVPDDNQYLASMMGCRPQHVSKAKVSLMSRGFLVPFEEDLDRSRIKDIDTMKGTPGIPPSVSTFRLISSESSSGTKLNITTGDCGYCGTPACECSS